MSTMPFTVNFWGVRGSMATARPDCCGVGGNTSCVEVRAGAELIILDAGTGLHALGESLRGRISATFLFSHFHWDHIQGFPFFAPLHDPDNCFTLVGSGDSACCARGAMENLLKEPHFPVTLADVRACLRFRSLRPGDELALGAATITCAALNHPQGCLGYRIEMGGRSVVYATDTEPLASGLDPAVLELARGASLLIYDAQYTESEYRGGTGKSRVGWGHSTVEEACRVAGAAGVEQLALFHHDPAHDDACIARLTRHCRALFSNVVAAREGMCIDLNRRAAEPYREASRVAPLALREARL